MKLLLLLTALFMTLPVFSQAPPIEPGVSHELAIWRAARYSDVRYKLNLTLEKMSPVLKGTIEIRVRVKDGENGSGGEKAETRPVGSVSPIILDWRAIKGFEGRSTISGLSLNGQDLALDRPDGPDFPTPLYSIEKEHIVLRQGVNLGENIIKLDFTSPILTSGSAITRYVDKEDGAEYIYSLFVPSDASTAFPVFDQPDLKARFQLNVIVPSGWKIASNTEILGVLIHTRGHCDINCEQDEFQYFATQPISTYMFAFTAGEFEVFRGCMYPHPPKAANEVQCLELTGLGKAKQERRYWSKIYVRKSQAAKFQPHAAEVFRLMREDVKYLENYFDYKFPFPKYDLVLIPEFPFGGMEHAGCTFLKESSVIFPQEPTKNDLVNRATLIFHETAHQWFGDTVTMRWFDDLWLKEGFATFMGYKAMEKIMPEMNAWKVFYERIKQGAYQTDSTKGTTAIYQPIANLSAAKSAYGNIVYNKAPAFLRQAEFYLGEDKFQTAVRSFLKKHEFANAGWEDLVKEFEGASNQKLDVWAKQWVTRPGVPVIRTGLFDRENGCFAYTIRQNADDNLWEQRLSLYHQFATGEKWTTDELLRNGVTVSMCAPGKPGSPVIQFSNFRDYGYGIFLLDDKSRDYVLKNIQNEKDDFLRSMMWGSLWDSVREGELDPREYVELVAKNLQVETDESTIATLLGRTGTALNYYVSEKRKADLIGPFEDVLVEKMTTSKTLGLRMTFFRAFLNIASTEKADMVLKELLELNATGTPNQVEDAKKDINNKTDGLFGIRIPLLRTKDRFDIVTRLTILGDPDAPKLLAALERSETSDDAKRYAYAARAGIGTAENKAKYWNDFVNNKEISESWIEAAFGPWNSIRQSELTLPYLQKALQELPNHKRNRKIFFVNGWLGAFIGGQRSEEALAIVNKFLADNPTLDNDLRLKILENVDLIERAVRIRSKYKGN